MWGKIEEGEANSHDCRISLRQDIEEIRRIVNYMKSDDSRRKYDDCFMEMNSFRDRLKVIETQLNITPPPIKKPISSPFISSDIETSTSKSLGDKANQSKAPSHKESKGPQSKASRKADSIIRKCKKSQK